MRAAVCLGALLLPAGVGTLLAGLWCLALAESVRITVGAWRAPVAATRAGAA